MQSPVTQPRNVVRLYKMSQLTAEQEKRWIDYYFYHAGQALREGDLVSAGKYLRRIKVLCSRVASSER
jgi:hypothetical protein